MGIGFGLGSYGIIIQESDGSPSGFGTKLKVSNSSLIDNGDGSFTLTTGAGATDHGALTGLSDDDHTQYHTASRANTWLGTKSLSDIGTKDHNLLNGLSDDDHSQYGLLAGRAGGQTLIGGAASGEGLALNSTSHATKGLISIGGTLYVDEANNRVGIGENAPTADFEINSAGGENVYIYRYGDVAGPPSIKYWKARGTEGSPSRLQADDNIGKFEFWGYVRNAADDGDAFLRTGYIISDVESVDAQERSKGRISFYVKTGYAVTNPDIMASIEPDGFLVEKTGTATAGTQYESWDLKMKCSVWDETNVQAEDRIVYWTLNAGSGANGSEPYYLSLYDNDDTEILRVDPLTPALLISDYFTHLGDADTSIYFREDRVTIYCGGRVMIDALEGAQDILYLGHDGANDIDVSIGPNGCLFIDGETGVITIGSAFTNTSLRVLDTNASHDLVIVPGSDLSADRTLTLTTGDSDRTITLSGNPTLDDWFDQSVKQAASPTFGGLTMNGNVTLTKTGTATNGSPYPSQDLILIASSWDALASQAEDRNFIIRNVGESDSRGDHYLSFLDNDSTELLRIFSDQGGIVGHSVEIPKRLSHLGDDDNYLEFDDDNITFIVGGTFSGCEFEISETGTDTSYFGFDSGNGQLKQRYFNTAKADDGTVSLGISPTYTMWGQIIATETDGTMGEWAEFIVDGAGDVILISNSANVVANADTDANLCIGTSASQEPLIIKNRLGGSRRLLCKIWWV